MSPDESGQHVPSEEDRSARNGQVPAPAVRRLSLYLRELEGILKQDGQTISSKQLGETLGLTDAQVRKDLAYFGQFGHPGIGYPVEELIVRIRGILGTDHIWNALLVGDRVPAFQAYTISAGARASAAAASGDASLPLSHSSATPLSGTLSHRAGSISSWHFSFLFFSCARAQEP